MQICEIVIRDFRNIRYIHAEFGAGLNVICGRNAQGKTNLLEAIYMLVTGRSFRTRSERELIPWNYTDYLATIIRARVRGYAGEDVYHLAFDRKQKFVSVNDQALTRLGELLGRLNAVLFTPADLMLVQGSPQQRRRFLDICLCQTSPIYLKALQRYDNALRRRNTLMKLHRDHKDLASVVAPYTEELAVHGAAIVAQRARALRELSSAAASHYSQIAQGGEELQIHYLPSPGLADESEDEVATLLRKEFRENFSADVASGSTSVGPHRDDFQFLLNNHDARHYASQGQQRSCVLALKLAELAFMVKIRRELPILLLDDLMSELDEFRREGLLAALPPETQTFVTTTDRELIPASRIARLYYMVTGDLRPSAD
ncbi:MAG: DNA replication/repair protein RecF [Candidatus Sumerlaeaceae bacterium]|nr:DNA replication/repair protein RecF [Candidatus Sumerlaeaceae bacterium]